MSKNRYEYKNPYVTALRVSKENIFGVAEWCGKDVKGMFEGGAVIGIGPIIIKPSGLYIEFDHPKSRAVIGDWVVQYADSRRFKALTHEEFTKVFKEA